MQSVRVILAIVANSPKDTNGPADENNLNSFLFAGLLSLGTQLRKGPELYEKLTNTSLP